MNNKTTISYKWGAFGAWLFSLRLLFPFATNDVYDFILWALYLLMVAMGLYGSWSLMHSFKKNSFVVFSIATGMYLLLRTFHFDSIIYISLWHSVFEIYPYTNLYLTLGGNPLYVTDTFVYAFFVPMMLIGAWIKYFTSGVLSNKA